MITSSQFLDQEDKENILSLKNKSLNIIEASDDWYFNDTKFVTNSHLKLLKNHGPKFLQEYYNGNIPKSDSPHFKLGSAFHMMVLQPELFTDNYVLFDDNELCNSIGGARPKATNKYKEAYEQFINDNIGKEILNPDEYNTVNRMAESIFSNTQARELLQHAKLSEKIFNNTIDGVNCKSKIDACNPDNYFIDLKSFFDTPNHDKFSREFNNKDYDMQAAFYSDVTECKNAWIIAVEKSHPYTIGIYEVSESTMERGRNKYKAALNEYKAYFINQDINTIHNIEKFCYMGVI